MADPPSEHEAPPTPPRAASVVSEDTAVLHHHDPPVVEEQQYQQHLHPAQPPPSWQWQQQQQQQQYAPLPMESPHSHPAVAMAQYYEARMREHAAEYASAAAGAAWAAAQIASSPSLPPVLPPVPPQPLYGGYEQQQQQQPQHQQLWHPPPQASEEHMRPGKRQQTMYANATCALYHPPPHAHYYSPTPPSFQQETAGYEHNNHNSIGGSSSNRSSQKRGRRRMRPDSANSSDNSREKSQRKQGRRQQQHQSSSFSDQTLLGKTGVSALHEWCAKRKLPPPQFVLVQPSAATTSTTANIAEGGDVVAATGGGGDGFTMSAQVEGKECGRGRGGTKGSAKQEAARQALQTLLPGVVFDAANGILVELPTSTIQRTGSDYSSRVLEDDLAPNLASRLAIGEQSLKKRQASSRSWDNVYPGTSTTSEDDDYLASRGASVCSALLHALWQIDDGIPEPPSYTYEVSVPAAAAAARAKRKGDAARGSAVAVRGSSFACTARLLVRRPLSSGDEKKDTDSSDNKETKVTPDDENNEEKLPPTAKAETRLEAAECGFETLTAVGTAGSKREARHAASAKLLAMLFPECNGMAEVKAAAEATRERYAASKALKMQSRRVFSHEKRKFNEDSTRPRKRSIDVAVSPDVSHSPLPQSLARLVKWILGKEATTNDEASDEVEDNDVVSVESLSLSEKEVSSRLPFVEESLSRSLSRRKQLDERVDCALQTMNELDDEGRCLPEELNSNDVGRTVLRRAEAEDADWILKLVANQADTLAATKTLQSQGGTPGPFALLGASLFPDGSSQSDFKVDNGEFAPRSLPSRLWGSTAITLLLCRAISPKDDPPLGCAVLTLGFSMAKGPTLRIAELVSEPHLPKERFIECLDKFSSHMNCALQSEAIDSDASSPSNISELVLSTDELKSVLRAHIGQPRASQHLVSNSEQGPRETETQQSGILDLQTISTSLQSVQEEEVEAEEEKGKKDEATDVSRASKDVDKPSKRSRVV